MTIDIAETRLLEATKRYEQAQASGDVDQIERAKKEMEAAFNNVAQQRK